MDHHGATGPSVSARWWGPATTVTNADVMNQLCRVCGEPAAGFHFGAFTCEGCKSFFGRTYNNLSSVSECKSNGECIINKKNRTSCKACRLRKCLIVGMSKSGSRYGRRSNWFKIHCLLQEQQLQQQQHQQQMQQTHFAGIGSQTKKPWEYGKHSATPLDIDNNNTPSDTKSESPPFTVSHGLVKSSESPSFWSGRPNPLTVPHQHALPYFISPFLQSPLQTISHNYLLPFLPIRPPLPLEPLVISSSPSSSLHSSPPLPPPTPLTSVVTPPEKEPPEEVDKSLEKLRSLGPIQEQPIDLSSSKINDSEISFRDKNCNSEKISKCVAAVVDCEEKQDTAKIELHAKSTVPLDLSCCCSKS